MEVYIEYVFIDNLVINFLILSLSTKATSINCSIKRKVFSAFLGAIFALMLPFISINEIFLIFLKLLLGVVMVLLLKKKYSVKEFIATFLFFITFTFAFGGICFAIILLLKEKTTLFNLICLTNSMPIGIIMLIVYLHNLILIKMLQYLKHKNMISNFVYEVKIVVNGKGFKLMAYLDSGNDLFSQNQKPIMVVSRNAFIKMYKKIESYKIFLNCVTNLDIKDSYYIDIKTVGDKQKMLIVTPDSVDIKINKNKFITTNALLGLSKQNFKNYDCLLNKNCFIK